jgi:hypothetical protein
MSTCVAIYRTNTIIFRMEEELGTSNSTVCMGQSYIRMRKVKFQANMKKHHIKSDLVKNLACFFFLWFFIHQIETFMLNYGSLIPFIRGLHTTSNGENYGLIS